MYNILLTICWLIYSSIYSISIQDTEGNDMSLSAHEGKKILIVNIATGSDKVSQLAALQQLQEQHSDRLVIIACPSASFGHESRTNAEIKTFCQSTYHTTFFLAAKNSVVGVGIQPLYNWLSHSSENGAFDGDVSGDFQKFLVDEEGNLIGSFSARVEPTDPKLVQLITQ